MFKKGEEIFGNQEEFQKWIEQPAYGLGFRVPKSMIQTSSGIDLVADELTRIEFGDLA
jgi:putative toxin-antitoxin system antitoxin component (TIGR02293 family)